MLDRRPERLDCLPGQRAAGQVDDRDRDPEREVRRDVAGGRDGGLGVQGVEDRLDEQEVGAALGQRLHLLGVGGVDLVEAHGPERRIVHARRQRQRDVQRADGACHELAGREAAGLVRRLPGQPGAGQVHVPD